MVTIMRLEQAHRTDSHDIFIPSLPFQDHLDASCTMAKHDILARNDEGSTRHERRTCCWRVMLVRMIHEQMEFTNLQQA